jgi:hypothetical protein
MYEKIMSLWLFSVSGVVRGAVLEKNERDSDKNKTA